MPRDRKDIGFDGLLDQIISEAMQNDSSMLSPVDYAREILGLYLFPAQRVVMKAFYGIPFGKGMWGDCISPDDPTREEKLRKWRVKEDQEFDEASIMDRWLDEKKALWVPGQRYKNLSLEAGMGSSKTVKDSLTFIRGEGYRYISELLPANVNEDITVAFDDTYIQTRFGMKKVNYGISRVKQKTLNVRTKSGYEVGGAPTHPVLTFTEAGSFEWKKLPEIKPADFICIDKKPVDFGKDKEFDFVPVERLNSKSCRLPNKITPELARFMGYLVGDGCYSDPKGSIGFTTADNELLNDFVQLAEKLFSITPTVSKSTSSDITYQVNMSRRAVRDLLEYLGLSYCTAYDKKIPSIIRMSSKESVKHFLRGLFDTDGFATCSVSKGKYGSKKRLVVGFASASKKLVEEIHVLLLGFGIKSTRANRQGNYKKQDGSLNTYSTISIYGKHARKFFTKIGFGLSRKQDVLKEAPEITVDTTDKIPYLHGMLRAMKLKEGMTKRGSGRVELWNKIRRQCGGTLRRDDPNGWSGITYDKLPEIIEYFSAVPGCEGDVAFLESLLEQNLLFDQVEELWETEEHLYDFSVPEVQEYVAGGVVSHNSSLTGAMSSYEFYRLTKMENPGQELGLLPGDPVFVLSIATNEQQAKDTIFAYTKARMESSAYFGSMIERGDVEVLTTEIVHRKKNVIFRAGHSRGAGLVGKNLWGLLMDEVNRFAVEPGASVESSGLALWDNVGKGTTRFKLHPDGGIKIGIGSAWQEGDMSDRLWKLVESGELDPRSVMCLRLCTWDVNPNYTGIDDPDLATFFATDPVGARRDYMGIRPGAQEDFFNKEMLKLYSTEQPVAQYAATKVYDAQGIALLDADAAKEMKAGEYRSYVGIQVINLQEMEFNKYSYAHADPGIKNDSFGFAVGHGEPSEKGLIAVIDLVLEWEPELDPNNPKVKIPVNLQDVEKNIFEVCQKRNVRRLSFDHWQNQSSLQRLYTQGVITEEITFTAPTQLAMYELFRHRLDNGLIRLPHPESSKAARKLHAELSKIQLVNGRKIDHPKGKGLGNSKDLADAVVTVVARIAQEERMYGLGDQSGVKMSILGATRISKIPKWK